MTFTLSLWPGLLHQGMVFCKHICLFTLVLTEEDEKKNNREFVFLFFGKVVLPKYSDTGNREFVLIY